MNLLKSLCCILTFNCFVVYATHSYPKQDTLYLSFDDAEKIFKSKEAQKFVSDKIVKELQREIDKIGTIKIR